MRDQEMVDLMEAYSSIYESQEVEVLDERKYDPDEELPSGETPNKKMERAQGKHGANYMLSKGDVRYPGAKNAHFERGTKVKKIKDIVKSGGDPRNDPSAGPGNDYDARKIGRPQKPMTGKKRRRDETDRERSNYTPGGLRADRTKAGGYRTLVRKEEFEGDLFDYLLEYLVAEGYADTNQAALAIMANMSEEWRESIIETFGFKDFRQLKKSPEPKPVPAPPTVQSSGGAGGKVTVDKGYSATLGGKKGVKSTDADGTEYFMPNVGKSDMPDYSKAQYKNKWTGKYQNIPSSQGYPNPQSHLSRTGVPRVYPRTANYGITD